MKPLRGGFPDGGGFRINLRARSLNVCALEAGTFASGEDDGVLAGGLAAPAGFSGEFWAVTEGGWVDAPGWRVNLLVESDAGVGSMSMINDYNSNFLCGCNLYANQLRPIQPRVLLA